MQCIMYVTMYATMFIHIQYNDEICRDLKAQRCWHSGYSNLNCNCNTTFNKLYGINVIMIFSSLHLYIFMTTAYIFMTTAYIFLNTCVNREDTNHISSKSKLKSWARKWKGWCSGLPSSSIVLAHEKVILSNKEYTPVLSKKTTQTIGINREY